jgi:hypothetical protein
MNVLIGLAKSLGHEDKFARTTIRRLAAPASSPSPTARAARPSLSPKPRSPMFKDLYAVARHTPLHLIITPAGDKLKIIVTPKPTGDAGNNAALAKPFSATGTPEDLDANSRRRCSRTRAP